MMYLCIDTKTSNRVILDVDDNSLLYGNIITFKDNNQYKIIGQFV